MNTAGDYASGSFRDLFLDALDRPEPERVLEIARHLVSCGNPLPSPIISPVTSAMEPRPFKW